MSIKLPVRLSHSAVSTWLECKEKYHLKYIERLDTKEKGASLAFGVAVEEAINCLLLGKKEGNLEEALKNYNKVFLDGPKGWGLAYKDKNIKYSTKLKDLDQSIFIEEDKQIIDAWETELDCLTGDSITAYKQKDFKRASDRQLELVRRLNWLSMKRKGELLLAAFIDQILPKIIKVISIQYKVEGSVGDSSLIGYIDLIAELEGFDYPVILDIKTSGMPYEADAVYKSEQLTIYTAALTQDLPHRLAGFIVLVKNIGKKQACSKCGLEKTTTHKTCNSESQGTRCHGEWISEPQANVQLLVEPIKESRQQDLLNSYSEVNKVIHLGLRIKEWKSCENWGGCEFKGLCHNNDWTGIIKKT